MNIKRPFKTPRPSTKIKVFDLNKKPVIFDTVQKCAEHFNVSRAAIRQRCDSDNFPDFNYCE